MPRPHKCRRIGWEPEAITFKPAGVPGRALEQVTLSLAGEVTQVLPDGNLVVMASQEFRVDNELRVLRVSGVIRPEDIASDNTIASDRMAEARIAYGGRGELSQVQAPRWGQQLMDILMPF